MFSLKEKEVNTGRQRELDLVKGFLMIMIDIYTFLSDNCRCSSGRVKCT